jgi:5-methylcytosine-specific restriction endonuclease McrA
MTDENEAYIVATRKRARWEAQLRWREKNPERWKALQKRSYEKNRTKRVADMQRRRDENPGWASEITKRYRQRHPERVEASVKKYRQAHPREAADRARAWRKANPDRVAEHEKRRKIENTTRHAVRYAKNKETMKPRAKQWRKDNPDKARDIMSKHRHRRRMERSGSGENYTIKEIRALRKKAGGKCVYCDRKGRMTIDHIVPLKRGGSNAIRNIQFACKSCNSSKNDRDPIDFARSLGMLL